MPVSFGFHPYLTLPGSIRRNWQVELPVARQALVDEHMIPTGETESIARGVLDGPLGNRTFDTGYDRLHGVVPEFTLADDRRQIALTLDLRLLRSRRCTRLTARSSSVTSR